MGAARLELAKTEVEGFTVPCNCRYATPPMKKKECWRKDLNPQPPDYKSGALPVELHQHLDGLIYSKINELQTRKSFIAKIFLLFPVLVLALQHALDEILHFQSLG